MRRTKRAYRRHHIENQPIAIRFKTIREALGLSLSDVAREAGKTHSYLSFAEILGATRLPNDLAYQWAKALSTLAGREAKTLAARYKKEV